MEAIKYQRIIQLSKCFIAGHCVRTCDKMPTFYHTGKVLVIIFKTYIVSTEDIRI